MITISICAIEDIIRFQTKHIYQVKNLYSIHIYKSYKLYKQGVHKQESNCLSENLKSNVYNETQSNPFLLITKIKFHK